MLIVRHPNRKCEGRAVIGAMLSTLCPSLTLGEIAAALARVRAKPQRRAPQRKAVQA